MLSLTKRKEAKTMISGFQNSTILLPKEGFKRTSLTISKGVISSIGEGKGIVIPAGLYVGPGFIDEHIHGSDGYDAMDGKKESIDAIRRALPQDGVTSFCPTTMTMGEKDILQALSVINDAVKENAKDGSRILGPHLEGPFISPVYKGAQSEEAIKKGDPQLMAKFYEACPSIKEVTFAYEENGKELLAYLVKKGILPSIGHTNCPPELLKEGIAEGIRCSTHTYNAMRRFTHRDVGVVGEVLLDERVTCEVIADLIHVAPDAIKLLYKCKGLDHIVLITDSMEAKHLPEGKYALGGQDVFVKDGAARLADGTLAGSVLTLNKAVKNAKEVLGLSLAEAVQMASFNPARNLSLEDRFGQIKKGYHADFAVVDDNLEVYLTIRDGEIIYKRPGFAY
jgi:N-acetylglucosamine-6-phosphate deacetylase